MSDTSADRRAETEQEMRRVLSEFVRVYESQTENADVVAYAYELAEAVKDYLFEMETEGEFS
jgi:hypothetical protein